MGLVKICILKTYLRPCFHCRRKEELKLITILSVSSRLQDKSQRDLTSSSCFFSYPRAGLTTPVCLTCYENLPVLETSSSPQATHSYLIILAATKSVHDV